MLRRILIGDNERVLVIRKRRFAEILGPGERWMVTLGRGIELQRHNIRDLVYAGDWVDYIVNFRSEVAARWFTVVETSDSQVALVFLDGRLARVIAPFTRVLFWKGAVNVTFERIDVRANPEVPASLLPVLARLGRESAATFASVDEGKRGLVYLDGRLVRELEPGNYGFWNVVSTPRVEVLEVRRQTVEVTGQEILTSDKVTVRVN